MADTLNGTVQRLLLAAALAAPGLAGPGCGGSTDASGSGAGASSAAASATVDAGGGTHAPPGRVVYDLVANRPSAHVTVGGNLVMEGGSPAFWKYVDGGWKSNWYPAVRDGEHKVALVQGIAGVVRFPLLPDETAPAAPAPTPAAGASAATPSPSAPPAPAGPAPSTPAAAKDAKARASVAADASAPPAASPPATRDLRLAFIARPAVPHQTLSLFVNEKPLANLTLADGYQTYEVPLPAAKLVRGDNTVRFHFRAAGTLEGKHTAAAFERICVGPKGARGCQDLGPAPRLGQTYGLGGDARRSLASTLPARFSYYLMVPPDARLELGYGTQESIGLGSAAPSATGEPAPMPSMIVRATSDEGPPVELWRGTPQRAWQDARIDLAQLAGQTVRLDLVLGSGGAFGEPRLVADKPRAQVPAGTKRPDHILIWMVDTLRADRLSAWNPETKVRTPGFDQLGHEATRFARTTVQGNFSLPSHTSLLTGVLPAVHGMNEDKDRLAPSLPLVSEEMKRAGFDTAIFSSNGYVSDKWGFKKGWDHYRNFIREDKPNGAAEVWKAAKAWLDGEVKADKRTFMYLATVDPHVAYNPPERFLKDYWPNPASYRGPIKPALTSEQLFQIKVGKLKPTDEDKRFLEALYDAEVTQNDAAFLQMVGDLKQMGIYDRTAIVVVSDHGDEFFDHGSVGHGHSLYQELVDVPLYVRWPPLFPEAKVVTDDAEVIDVYSTVLDLAGMAPNDEAQGESLAPLAADDGPRMDRPAESFHDGAIRALRLGRWKLITWSGARSQLYDLATDPHEQHDLAPSRPIALRYARDVFSLLHAYETTWHKGRWGVATDLKPAFTDDAGM